MNVHLYMAMNYEDEDEREKGETVRLMLISFSFSLFGRSVMLFRLQMTFSPLSSPMYVSAHTHTHFSSAVGDNQSEIGPCDDR